MNAVFAPLGIALGLAAGAIAKKIFGAVWGLVDDEEAPAAKHREIPYVKLIAALVVEGAIFKLVRGMTDHGSRHAWRKVTGTWPGEERPDPE